MSERETISSDEGSGSSMSEDEITESEESSETSMSEGESTSDHSSEYTDYIATEDEEDLTSIITLYGRDNHHLEDFLEDLSNNPSRQYSVNLKFLRITRSLTTRLLPSIVPKEQTSSSLLQDDENTLDHDVHSPVTTDNDTPFRRCKIIKFVGCRFFSQSDVTIPEQNDDVCTPDDKCCFISALARYPFCSIILHHSPEILKEILSISEIISQVKAQELEISQIIPLSNLEFIKLGAVIQRSVQLASLKLTIPWMDVPQAFCCSLTNSIHLQKLKIVLTWNKNGFEHIVGEGGLVNGVLRNSQHQLVYLSLKATALEDHHLIALAKLLPASKVETLNFAKNNIQSHGLLEFVRLVPNMQFLTRIFFSCNPWERSAWEVREECGKALLQGVMKNACIIGLHHLQEFPQRRRLRYQLGLNRVLRKLLKSSCPHCQEDRSIPDALWPHIVARVEMCREKWEQRLPVDSVDAVYSFLQQCPGIFSCQNKQQPQPFS